MGYDQDRELQQYRDLVAEPDHFEDGFSLKTVAAALFLGFLMIPGSIYLSLVAGAGLNEAARWVTVILFAEVAKRSMKNLRQQEIYILFFMVGIALGGQLHGGIMTQLLWNQYLVQSPAIQNFGIEVPAWVSASAESIAENGRTFFTREWMPPMFFLLGMLVLGRIDHFGLGYALYRLTAHVEKLPFPMAPVGALGITALADVHDREQRWRWKWFSIGSAMGLAFGLIYIGVPAITGALLATPVKIIPIPFIDLTMSMSRRDFLPAMPLNLVFDLTLVILGMVLPFWAVVGGMVGLIITLIANPILYHQGLLTTWTPGMNMIDTIYSNHVDFYLSFGIGLALSIFLFSLWPIIKAVYSKRRERRSAGGAGGLTEGLRQISHRNRDRGDISVWLALAIYLFSTSAYVGISLWLMPGTEAMGYRDRFPWAFFLGFGLIYQPIISYVNAKLEGMVGQSVAIPYVREAAFIFSGYRGSAIWFAPIPLNDYGGATRSFRILELTGTRLTSIIKAELLVIPIVVVSSLVFSNFIWRIAPIPSQIYPTANELWELQARNAALTMTATLDGSSEFIEAIKPPIVAAGGILGLAAFFVLSAMNLPVFLVFGIVRGLGQSTPGNVIPEIIGALVGRYWLEKKYGTKQYKQYVSILLAGFSAGMGLIGMGAVAFALIVKSTSASAY